MATIKYLLKRKANREGKCPIYIAIYDKDETELISTKRFIQESFWDSDNRCIKQVKNLPEEAKTIQADLSAIMRTVTRIQARLRLDSDSEPTGYQIRQEYKRQTEARDAEGRKTDADRKQSSKQVTTLITAWENSLLYRKLTIKAVKDSMKKFTEFLKVSGNSALEVKDITRELIGQYEKWLLDKKKLSDSSHGRHIKHLRWFLKTLKMPFNVRDEIKLRTYTKPIIALTLNELAALEKVDVSYSKDYQRAKDMFLLGCYLGLRISDLKRISPATIQDQEIKLDAQVKTKKPISTPILPETAAILNRYQQRAPKITEQALNRDIKEVCRLAGITTEVQLTKTKGGKDITINYPKHKLISSHASGKTFITLARIKWGLEPAEIASIVGKDIATLLKHYFKNDNSTAKQKMLANYKPPMAINEE